MNADLGSGTDEEIQTIVKDYWSAQEPILASMEPAPDPIKTDVETLLALARQGASTGDSATFTSPDVQTADRNIDQYVLRECGYGQISITATDNAYEGIPATIGSGAVGITLNNAGREAHQVLIVRIDDGVTEPFSALLDLPPDLRMQLATALGSIEVDPGGVGTLFLRLAPGRYGVGDFLSQGTVRPRHVRQRRTELRCSGCTASSPSPESAAEHSMLGPRATPSPTSEPDLEHARRSQCENCHAIFLDRGELEHVLAAEDRFYGARRTTYRPAAIAGSPIPRARTAVATASRTRRARTGARATAATTPYSPRPYGHGKRKKSFLGDMFGSAVNPLVCTRCVARVTQAAPLVCEACGHEQEFVRRPLYYLAGPSGTGKSTVAQALLPLLTDRFVVM